MISNLAIQLNAFKKQCETDLDGTLEKLRQLGFKGIEPCEYFGRTPEEFNELMKKYGLTIVASHIKMEHMLDYYDDVVEFHRGIGCNRIVITFGEITGLESLSMLVNNLNSLQRRLAAFNIELLYHNHEQEFKKYSTGNTALTEIMTSTKVDLELDAFWAEQAGADVIELLEQYKDRIPLIHIKDGINHIPTAIGAGTASVKRVYDYAVENKMEWIIVELSSKMDNPMKEIEDSVAYIRENL